MKKFTKLAIAAAITAATSFGAAATPVTEFFFSQNVGFADPTSDLDVTTGFFGTQKFSVVTPLLNPADPAGTYATMQWTQPDSAFPDGVSSITTTGYTDASGINAVLLGDDGLWNEGEVAIISTLTQNNQVIGGSFPDPLWIADVIANLRIFSDSAHATLPVHDELGSATRIRFYETLNTPTCPSDETASVPCEDIYTVALSEFAPTSFNYNGVIYELQFSLIPGPGTKIKQVGDNLLVYTPEGQNSKISVGMSWHAVPEPGSLALAGLGLTALAALRRRKSLAA